MQRQITGWMGRWEKAKTREVPLMNKLGAWFLEHMPAPQKPVLLHNDFYLHNVMFAPDNSGKVVGVFDWEMSTLGDPMIDLGLTISYWRQADDPPELIALSEGYAHTTAPGFLSRDELLAALRDAQRTRREHGGLLSGMGELEDRHGGRADLRPLCARTDQRPALCQHGRVGAGAGARRRRESLRNSALGSKPQMGTRKSACENQGRLQSRGPFYDRDGLREGLQAGVFFHPAFRLVYRVGLQC